MTIHAKMNIRSKLNIKAKLALIAATGSLLLAVAAAPATAASVQTEAFLANIRPNIDFLDRSSRLALTNSANPRLKAFARSEATEQTITANTLVAWVQANTMRGAVATVTPPGTLVPTVTDLATVPVTVGQDLTTGRSVAVDVPVGVDTTPGDNRVLLPAGQTDLDRLSARRGRDFDRLYRGAQADALRQLQTLYSAYILNGDVPDLRAISQVELPKINKRILELRRL